MDINNSISEFISLSFFRRGGRHGRLEAPLPPPRKNDGEARFACRGLAGGRARKE